MKPPRKVTGMAVMMAAIFALFTSGKDAFGQLDPTFHPPFFAGLIANSDKSDWSCHRVTSSR